jgi:hypothetical protein
MNEMRSVYRPSLGRVITHILLEHLETRTRILLDSRPCRYADLLVEFPRLDKLHRMSLGDVVLGVTVTLRSVAAVRGSGYECRFYYLLPGFRSRRQIHA